MAASIGPGDYVECVNVERMRGVSCRFLRLGAVYRVTWAGRSAFGVEILRVAGIELPPGKRGFQLERFRPIYRPKADLIESLKAPIERVCEPA